MNKVKVFFSGFFKHEKMNLFWSIGLSTLVLSIVFFAIINYRIYHDTHTYIVLNRSLAMGGGFLIGFFCCYLLRKDYGQKKQLIAESLEFDDKTVLGKREQQHQVILAVIDALNYQPLEIPTGGKTKIKEICLNRTRVFTDSAFDHAWKTGTSNGLFKLLESNKFLSK